MVATRPLKQYREDRGITQKALGKELGVTPMTIWRWENGKRVPRRRDILRISEKTGLSPTEVLGFPEPAEVHS